MRQSPQMGPGYAALHVRCGPSSAALLWTGSERAMLTILRAKIFHMNWTQLLIFKCNVIFWAAMSS